MHTSPFELLSQFRGESIFMHCKESPFQPSAAAQRNSLNRRLRGGKKDYRVDIQTTKAKPCRVFQSERNNSDLIPRADAHFPQQPLPQREKKETKLTFSAAFCVVLEWEQGTRLV